MNDFRVRKMPDRECYRVLQRVGSGWESLSDWYPSRAEARAAIERFGHQSGGMMDDDKDYCWCGS